MFLKKVIMLPKMIKTANLPVDVVARKQDNNILRILVLCFWAHPVWERSCVLSMAFIVFFFCCLGDWFYSETNSLDSLTFKHCNQ
jgi:hypothetical protein